MAAPEPLHLRIFLSSPGDVAEERKIARELIAELPRQPLLRGKVSLDVIAYDDPDAPAPMSATETPQASVNRYSGRPADCDLTIVILWSRLGTPLPADVKRADDTRYESGTVWELEDARQAGKEIWIYRRTEKPLIDVDDPDFETKRSAFNAVKTFFAGFTNPDGSLASGFNAHSDAAAFRALSERHLEAFVRARLESATEREFPQPPPVPPDLELLRGSARTILKLYCAKVIHDNLHEIYLKACVLRGDPAHIDGGTLSVVAAYCEARMTSIAEAVAECDRYLNDSNRTSIEGHRLGLERGIALLRAAAGSTANAERPAAVGEFNERLARWLSELDNVLKELADRFDGDEIRAAIGRLGEAYAVQLEPVERNLQVLMKDVNPVLKKCKALIDEHHGLQDVHDKFPGLFDWLTKSDVGVAASEWRRLKRRLNSAREAWKQFGELPSAGENWEEDVRDDGEGTWKLADTCISSIDSMLLAEAAADTLSQMHPPLLKLRDRVETHFKRVDEALREGYRPVKVRVGEAIMQIQ